MKPGVTLESEGKNKIGPPPEGARDGVRQMSRKEYVAMAANEVASFQEETTKKKSEAEAKKEKEEKAAAEGEAAAATAAAPGASDSTGTLPQIDPGRGPPGAAGGRGPAQGTRGGSVFRGRGPGGAGGGGGPQQAPPAPPPYLRSKKFKSIGHLGRPPRYHSSPLGDPFGLGSPQPPLGATMGHGLVRDRSLKEAYFFPSPRAQEPFSPLLRSRSESAIRPSSRGSGTAKSAEDKDLHGRIVPDNKSSAYRSVRHALFADEQRAGMAMSGGFM